MLSSEPIRAPDLDELETLVACAAEGTLVAAATRLGISRPAVAKRIKNLEALAGRPLLHRGKRGVRLTDAGATLLAGARHVLDDRDVLMSLISEIRGEGPSPIAGLRELLGHTPEASRAANQPEARLTETERVLELVLSASATGVVISDPETGLIHEVNDAFCRFSGRSRFDLIGKHARDISAWYDLGDRERLIDEAQRAGVAEGVVVRVQRPDGTLRIGETSTRFVALAGTRQLLSSVDDITEQHLLEVERTAGIGCYRAFAQLSKLLLAGQPPIESLARVLPVIHSSGPLATVALWDLEHHTARSVTGDRPPSDIDQKMHRRETRPGQATIRIGEPGSTGDTPSGWAVLLPSIGHALILLSNEPLPTTIEARYIEMLADLADLCAPAC